MYHLEPLSFLFQDVEPFIDIHTMALHYLKHQKNYLNQLNQLLVKRHFSFSYPVEQIYQHLDEFDSQDKNDLLFYLGGVVNHNLYWQSINPIKKELPNASLMKAIEQEFGSYYAFKEKFLQYALELKGSGYVFLVKTKEGKLSLQTMMNQDSPLLFGNVPLFCIDMWEHAYYLNYKNNKQEYIDNFFELANFSYANRNFL